MRLTTLDIKGFKSFADKTSVRFNGRITGIVGPNGCGKSNIVDAIRWVLGEQKTSMLRLEKMDNLIFNGSKNRRAGGLAEVSLTFENTKNILPTEFQTVTITRRLFRSGDSEYRLNDVPCRLKDIRNLFLDTGISSDSYAIIELGMVDEILNDREQSRRRLFEQASGISKYKIRKKETLRKLKGTTQDLARVEDLLYEIEGNMTQLERQAKRAKKYNKLKADYKETALEWARVVLVNYKTDYKSLEKKQAEQEDKRIELDKALMKAESRLEKEKLDSLEHEKALAAIQKELNKLTGGVSHKENEINVLRERIKFNHSRQDEADTQLRELEPRITAIDAEVKRLQHQWGKQREEELQAKQELEKQQAHRDKLREAYQKQKQEVEGHKKEYEKLSLALHEAERKQVSNQTAREKYSSDLFRYSDDAKRHKEEQKNLKKHVAEAEKKQASAKKELEQQLAKEDKRRTLESELQAAYEQCRDKLSKVRRSLDAQQNEYQLTKSLVESLEGYPESIQYLRKSGKWESDAPLLGDILTAPEAYRPIIETYLEPFLSHYVVRNKEQVDSGIALLRNENKGKAGFLVMDNKPEKVVLPTPPHPALEPVARFIETDSVYEKLLYTLLQKAYFVSAQDLPKVKAEVKNIEDIHLLVKEGGLLIQGNRYIGGSTGLFEGKRMGRAKHLKKLEKDIEALQKQEKKLAKESESLKQQWQKTQSERNDAELEAARNLAHKTERTLAEFQTRWQTLAKQMEEAKLQRENLEEAIEELKAEEAAIEKQKEGLLKERDTLAEQLNENDKLFLEAEKQMEQANAAVNEKQMQHLRLQNESHRLEREVGYKESERKDAKERIARYQKNRQEAEAEIKRDAAQLKTLETSLLEGYENKEVFEKKVADAETAYYDSRNTIGELEKAWREKQKEKQAADALQTEIKDRFNELKIELSSLRERLSIEFQADINTLLNEDPKTDSDRDLLQQQMEKQKGKLERFGEVNPMAVEAFEEMKERHVFITTQRDDLLDAKKTLEDTIDEIETSAKEQFLTAFYDVRENFKKVFRTLFTEDDTCDLKLTDEDNPLESKIEIIARPKGKRPQIIDQLSGGEKTLTATALLFSLYLLKPAPFCVFDEVDAPLDDNNIDKFNNIIREFSSDSQFIIVTHNKQTMSHVDIIYGVTMAEPGVSKVVPVDFSQLDKGGNIVA